MAELNDKQVVAAICSLYHISETERNNVLFRTGEAFAARFTRGDEMRKERLYWEVFKQLFTEDDRGILSHPDFAAMPYGMLKEELVSSAEARKAFCRRYHGLKYPGRVNRRPNELDVWRKRLIASVGGWLTATGKQGGMEVIKAIACRAAQKDDFNAIPKQQLVSLYNAFVQKQKDLKTVNNITQ